MPPLKNVIPVLLQCFQSIFFFFFFLKELFAFKEADCKCVVVRGGDTKYHMK